MTSIILFYFACTMFVLLGQVSVVGTSWLIGRRLHRSSLAMCFLVAYLIAAVRTIRSLPVFADEDVGHILVAYSSPDSLVLAALQPIGIWLIVLGLWLLYWDLRGGLS